MTRFLVLVSLVIAVSFSYGIYNDPSTAYGSCQEVLTKNPLAVDGLYYINNNELVDPYLTLCLMTVNGGGWTMFYKNNNEAGEGQSYYTLYHEAQGFITKSEDISSTDVVGVSPIEGLDAVSILAMPVNSVMNEYSAVNFYNVSVAESVLTLDDLVEGENTYGNMTYSEFGKNDFNFTAFIYDNGVISIPTGFNTSFGWFGNVNKTDSDRLLSCGSLKSSHCMYFVREKVEPIDSECMCHAVGTGHTIWPETKCGQTRTLSCHEGSPNQLMMRECDAHGQWKDYIVNNCTCSEIVIDDTTWPETLAGETARVSCANDQTMSRNRQCYENGEWSNTMTGGCTCNEENYNDVHWDETQGGQMAEHLCSLEGVGSGYHRFCNVDGTWSPSVDGSCSCVALESNGIVWEASPALGVQEFPCTSGAVGEGMSRTCSAYGSWSPIQGHCDCPQVTVGETMWPQTVSGYTAIVPCAAEASGTPSTRFCNPGGSWGEIEEGSCSCPLNDWSNYAGTHYVFPETMEGSLVIMPCAKEPEMNITRFCGSFGTWEEPEGCEEAVYCPAETHGELTFDKTEGGHSVMIMCAGSSSKSYGRVCYPNGQWGEVIGYCECEETTDTIGNHWPTIRNSQVFEQSCASGYSGQVSRGCSFFGEWYEISNTCTRNMCSEEVLDGITWPAIQSLTTHVQLCSDDQRSIQRSCNADGEWEPVEGSCMCPETMAEEGLLPESPVGASVNFACSENYTGFIRYECGSLGVWESVDECEYITCPAEMYQGVEWPATHGGKTAVVNCTSSAKSSNSRYCRPSGKWSSVVEGDGCYCDPTTVDENGFYVFAQTEPGVTVTKVCADLYAGSISYHCSRSGAWTDLKNECKRIQCPGEWIGGLYFNATDSDNLLHVNCDEGALGSGYDRYCGASGQWEKVSGECRCPAETIRHIDGHLYNFYETEGGVDVPKSCGGDLAGSVSRMCSMLGSWQPIRGECTHLVCPEERIGNFVWPATNSSTEVHMPCGGYQVGSVSRMCYASGIWGNPVNNCTSRLCDVTSTSRLDNGCMILMFNTPMELPHVRAQMVPDHSQDLSIVNHGRAVRACGMEVNVEYLFFVEYCEDAEGYSCSSSCMLDSVYYHQICYEMPPIDVVEVESGSKSTKLTFSSKLSECPGDAYALDVMYQCVEGCMDTSEHVNRTLCNSVGGCKAGERLPVYIEDEFPENAVFQVRQRLVLNTETSNLHPYSSPRTFRVSDLTRASEVTPTAEFLNSQMVRLHLGDVTSGLIVYRKHTIYIYKKLTGTRRLVDSLFSTVTLCPRGDTVCEETYTDVVVERGYDYSFSIYSYPMITRGKVVVSTVSITAEKTPSYSMSLIPGDDFMIVSLSGAKYPLSGYCSFQLEDSFSSPELVFVTLPKDETVSVSGSGLVPNSPYVVSCVLRDEMNAEGLEQRTIRTQAELRPTLELVYQSGTTYDVDVAATVNKPCSLYCSVTEANQEMTAEELISIGTRFSVSNILEPYIVNLLLFGDESMYRVSCVAVDGFSRYALQSILITRSNIPYVPELISSVPENQSSDVVAPLSMELTFKYPVTVKPCSSCFFVLYNLNKRTSLNLFNTSYSVDVNRILFNPIGLESDTSYQLKASTRELISDTATGAFLSSGETLISFKSKKFAPVDGDVVNPNELVPVNGVLEILFTNYLFLNEGSISINSLSINAANQCLQLVRPSESTTLLRIPLVDCVGMLRPDASYVLVLPEGLLRSRDGVSSPRLTHVFQTVNESFAPHVIDSYPEHLDSYVPLDSPLRLYFDQPVFPGDGFVFISEYEGGEYVNSYNIPGSKAVFEQTFPYEVSWEEYLFTLKPYHTYVVSWSEGVVVNAYDQPIAASTAAETIEFESAKSACSADFLAENSHGVFQCTYENSQCVCTQWNLIAMTR